MQSLLNKKNHPIFLVCALLLLLSFHLWHTKIKECAPGFDCNSYIQMMNNLRYDPAVPGHHAMRVVPSLIAGLLHNMGLSIKNAFYVLSATTYVALGLLVFWFLRKFGLKLWQAFGFTLLAMEPHHAMRIPLKTPYQAADMMTYPLTLALIYCSLTKRANLIFLFSIIGLGVRQNLFVLGELSLIYCFIQTKQWRCLSFAVILAGLYAWLQSYYHATSTFAELLHPPAGFFSPSHLVSVMGDSQILELFIPIIPFVIVSFKSLVQFFLRYWHIALYMGIVIGQPLLGYHLTGFNLPRLALQGVWILFLAAAMVSKDLRWTPKLTAIFVLYSLVMFFTWGLNQKLLWMSIFTVMLVLMLKPYFSFMASRTTEV